jgi:alpha-beta hydrolase superfamily lysophospholipase
MYENFKLYNDQAKLIGYSWDLENPKTVVCIIHGIGEHAGRYDRMAVNMNESNLAVFSMDLRGHGISSGKRGHCSPRLAILSDIDCLLYEIQNRHPRIPLVIYGHSMGGNIALDYRRRGKLMNLPVGYVISAPWIILVRKVSELLLLTMKIFSEIKPDFQIKAKIKNEDLGNVQVISQQQNRELRHDYITARTAIDGNAVGYELLTTRTTGKKMLLMHGSLDKICSVEGSRKFSKVANDCEYVEWEGYFHEIHNGNEIEDGQKVINYAIKWIQDL